jgi:hypothetical protein
MSTEKFWYPSSKETIFTSPDNGGALVKFTLTWAKAFDEVTNNDLLNLILCHVAKTFQIPPIRVVDAYGGWCGNPSDSLPAASTAATTPATTTATDTTATDTTATDTTATTDDDDDDDRLL